MTSIYYSDHKNSDNDISDGIFMPITLNLAFPIKLILVLMSRICTFLTYSRTISMEERFWRFWLSAHFSSSFQSCRLVLIMTFLSTSSCGDNLRLRCVVLTRCTHHQKRRVNIRPSRLLIIYLIVTYLDVFL